LAQIKLILSRCHSVHETCLLDVPKTFFRKLRFILDGSSNFKDWGRVTRCGCEKVAQNIGQPIFVNIIATPNCGKSGPKMWAISVIFNRLSQLNSRQLGENSPNLVTLDRSILVVETGAKSSAFAGSKSPLRNAVHRA
jgi:hypothetical protein